MCAARRVIILRGLGAVGLFFCGMACQVAINQTRCGQSSLLGDATLLTQSLSSAEALVTLSTDPDGKKGNELLAQAKRRMDDLYYLAQSEPDEAAGTLLTTGVLQSLSGPLQPYLEKEKSNLSGSLMIAESFSSGQSQYQFQEASSGKIWPVFFTQNGQQNLQIQPGQPTLLTHAVELTQSELNSSILLVSDFSGKTRSQLLRPPERQNFQVQLPAGNFGLKTSLVVPIQFANQTQDLSSVGSIGTNVVNQANAYWLNASDSTSSHPKFMLDPTMSGIVTLPGVASTYINCSVNSFAGPSGALINDVQTQLIAQGLSWNNYYYHLMVFPKQTNCLWDGLATIPGTDAYANGIGNLTLRIYAHEFGHLMGLNHSNAYNCGASSSIGSSCTDVGVGDPSDSMGNQPGATLFMINNQIYFFSDAYYNSFHKERLGWLSVDQGNLVEVQTSGNYEIGPYEISRSQHGLPTALKILKENLSDGSSNYYYLELRQPILSDSNLANFGMLYAQANLVNGVQIRQGNSAGQFSYILDMNPSTTGNFYDAALIPGKTFQDPSAPNGGVTVTVQSLNWLATTPPARKASISIQFGGSSGGCVHSQMSIHFSNHMKKFVSVGESQVLQFTVKNNDSIGCTEGTFQLSLAYPNGLQISPLSKTVVLSAQASQAVSFQVQLGASASDTLYPLKIKADRLNDIVSSSVAQDIQVGFASQCQ